MEATLQDVRYALRGLRDAPGFTAVAVATLALGIGVNSTIFSVVNAVLLRPLPVERPGELVDIYGHTATSNTHDSSSYPDFLDFRTQAETLAGLTAYSNFFANLSIDGSSELVIGEIVADNYFSLLGVEPPIGRAFVAEEFAAPGAGPVAVLSQPFWRSRFGADPDVVGRTLRMNGIVYTVVGVAPEGFGGMFPGVSAQMWIPISMVEEVEPLGNQRGSGGGPGETRLDRRGQRWLWMRGRMRAGADIEAVRAELEGIAARLAEEYPDTNELERITVLPTSDVAINPDFDGTVTPAGILMLGLVGLVLLVACANLANLMLARASGRRREIAVRLALGAGGGRLVRQLLTESLILALAGGVAAAALAAWLTGLVARFQPPLPIDLALTISPDWRVLLFTLLAAGATGVLFGLVPAIRASRTELVPALKDSGDGASRGDGRPGGGRLGGGRLELRDGLVVVQVAVSIVLVVAGILLARSLGAAERVDFGYDVDRTAFFGLAMEMNGYDAEESAAFYESARLRLEALPQVQAVALTSRVPLSLNNNGFGLFVDGRQTAPSDRPYVMDGARVDERYFEALGLDIVEGRGIEFADRDEGRRVAVVSETMAATVWPDASAVGKQFRTSWEGTPYRIVGVVEDYKVDTPGEASKPYIHLPLPRATVYANILVRTAVEAGPLVPLLEREIRTLDADLLFLDTGALRDLAAVRLFPIRAAAWLIGAFGALALAVAAVGLYGVIGYSVSRRVREIGIRKALGAERAQVVGLVLRRGMLMVAVGGLVGAGLAAATARLLSSVLFVRVLDPTSFAIAFAVFAGVAALAHWVPARRAARVDPMLALRGE